MSLEFFLLFVLTFLGGLSYAWLGAGSGAILVPFLPHVSPLSALGAVQASLMMSFFISFMNALVFHFQKLILWSFVRKALFFIIISAFFAGFCVGFLSSFQIRFLLWLFFLFVLLFPLFLKPLKGSSSVEMEELESRKAFSSKRASFWFPLCSLLAGVSTGMTGVGGGLILAPFFHESRLMPSKNIPAVLAVIFFFVTGFSLLGQISQKSLSLTGSFDVFTVCLQILPGYVLGSFVGYALNKRQEKTSLRKAIVRFLVVAFFVKMTLEVFKFSQ